LTSSRSCGSSSIDGRRRLSPGTPPRQLARRHPRLDRTSSRRSWPHGSEPWPSGMVHPWHRSGPLRRTLASQVSTSTSTSTSTRSPPARRHRGCAAARHPGRPAAAGARLPSTRALAADLGVARGTVADAYDQLVIEGWLAARHGSGNGRGGRRPARGRAARPLPTTWRRRLTSARAVPTCPPSPPRVDEAVRRVLHELLTATSATATHAGWRRGPDRDYVARTRPCAPTRRVVITSGFTQALASFTPRSPILGDERGPGGPCIPAYRERSPAPACGCTLAGRRRGADPSSLGTATGVGAAVLTPGAPVPDRTTLAPARRTAVIGWRARPTRMWSTTTTTASSATTASRSPRCKRWTPTAPCTSAPPARAWRRRCGWRGWCCRPLVDSVVAAKGRADRQTSVLDQATLAELSVGRLDRHVRRSLVALPPTS
jgi:GntR family transcriptional regulator/MocR family aminotransferase